MKNTNDEIYRGFVSTFSAKLSTLKNKTNEDFQNLFNDPTFKHLMKNSPSHILIYNFSTNVYEFVSDNTFEIFGIDKRLKGELQAIHILQHIHPSCQKFLGEKVIPTFLQLMMKYVSNGRAMDLLDSSVVKISVDETRYKWMLMQVHIVDTDHTGMPLRSITFVSDITAFKKDESFVHTISAIEEGTYKVIFTQSEPETTSSLTVREIEILKMVAGGMTSKEIAGKLFLSVHTVNTHRTNILEKTKSKSSSELISTAHAHGWI